MSREYRFNVIVRVEDDAFPEIATMEVYDSEDIEPVALPIGEGEAPYYEGMDLGTVAYRAWEVLAIPPRNMPEIDDLIRNEEESYA